MALLDVVATTDPDTTVASICRDCEDDLVWNSVEVGPAGTYGYADDYNRTAVYATRTSDRASNETADAATKKLNNILCRAHFEKLNS
ncbi:hypothetical protein EA472_12785 [Natrarchaeobius oligotrophus]|uniref:Uncharacterized protein n=1 Tax=Natrarchaeobius chitinivorans TaxID=1679083 RepID=A0A3N6M8S6_NATCH|nr:hypothetical protein EA472_12785 [Natrarchaeobius chitinivorans]